MNKTKKSNESTRITIGRVIKGLRETMDLTREDLAKKIKIRPGYIAQIERDEPVTISPRIVSGLEKIFQKSLKKHSAIIIGHNYFVNRYRRDCAKRREEKH